MQNVTEQKMVLTTLLIPQDSITHLDNRFVIESMLKNGLKHKDFHVGGSFGCVAADLYQLDIEKRIVKYNAREDFTNPTFGLYITQNVAQIVWLILNTGNQFIYYKPVDPIFFNLTHGNITEIPPLILTSFTAESTQGTAEKPYLLHTNPNVTPITDGVNYVSAKPVPTFLTEENKKIRIKADAEFVKEFITITLELCGENDYKTHWYTSLSELAEVLKTIASPETDKEFEYKAQFVNRLTSLLKNFSPGNSTSIGHQLIYYIMFRFAQLKSLNAFQIEHHNYLHPFLGQLEPKNEDLEKLEKIVKAISFLATHCTDAVEQLNNALLEFSNKFVVANTPRKTSPDNLEKAKVSSIQSTLQQIINSFVERYKEHGRTTWFDSLFNFNKALSELENAKSSEAIINEFIQLLEAMSSHNSPLPLGVNNIIYLVAFNAYVRANPTFLESDPTAYEYFKRILGRHELKVIDGKLKESLENLAENIHLYMQNQPDNFKLKFNNALYQFINSFTANVYKKRQSNQSSRQRKTATKMPPPSHIDPIIAENTDKAPPTPEPITITPNPYAAAGSSHSQKLSPKVQPIQSSTSSQNPATKVKPETSEQKSINTLTSKQNAEPDYAQQQLAEDEKVQPNRLRQFFNRISNFFASMIRWFRNKLSTVNAPTKNGEIASLLQSRSYNSNQLPSSFRKACSISIIEDIIEDIGGSSFSKCNVDSPHPSSSQWGPGMYRRQTKVSHTNQNEFQPTQPQTPTPFHLNH